jgi:hypothetical protein
VRDRVLLSYTKIVKPLTIDTIQLGIDNFQSTIVVTQSLFDDSNSDIDRIKSGTASAYFKSDPQRLVLIGPVSFSLGTHGATAKVAKKEVFFHRPFAIPSANSA